MTKYTLPITLFVAVIAGLISGILGFSLASQGTINPFYLSKVNMGSDPSRQVVIDQPRNVVVQQDLQVKQIEDGLLPAIVNIYASKKSGTVLEKAYLPQDALGQGFVLTADGWIISVKEVIDDLSKKYIVIGYQNKQFELTNLVEDKTTGLVFGKINANNLTVAKLGNSSELSLGQTLAAITSRDKLNITTISKIGYDIKTNQDLILSSDNFSKQIFFSTQFINRPGMLLTNFKGEVVAIGDGQSVLLVDNFKNIVNQVLAGQKISRAELGLKYLDLSKTEGLIAYGDKGALVYENPVKGSATFGLIKEGDVIKKIDGTEINSFKNLSDIINNYKTGDKIEIDLIRSGKDVRVEVKLN